MLELRDVDVRSHSDDESAPALLADIFIRLFRRQFVAVVGPSGCGKSTLLKLIAGIMEPSEGKLLWDGRDLMEQEDLDPGAIGYVPQFSIAHEHLTVRQNLRFNLALRRGLDESLDSLALRLADRVGLTPRLMHPVRVLSGGQKRRLALALELASSPEILLCDEVTSGLDVRSETEVLELLRSCANENRLVINVTHSLRHLELYDYIVVLHEGRIAYQGLPSVIGRYFRIEHPEEMFPALTRRTPDAWHVRAMEPRWFTSQHSPETMLPAPEPEAAASSRPHPPGELMQFGVLLARRMALLVGDPGQLMLQLALLIIFPALVVLFALNGLPAVQNMTMTFGADPIQQLRESVAFSGQMGRIGSLVSGLAMMQVILLTLMASNNAAREIAGNRLLIEKEKLAGLSPVAHLGATTLYLAGLVVAQGLWMTWFVRYVCGIPGEGGAQALHLVLVNAAMTATCLAVSAWSKNTERASLLSVYLVGFQLPLSGALLTLPDALGTLVRPFIASYWAWSGYLQTLRETRYYDLVTAMTSTPVAIESTALWMLCSHTVLALAVAYLGLWRSDWRAE
jgi:ABC-type multidrug transport system ATPase subunit